MPLNEVWVERYRPDTLDDIVGNGYIVESLQEWAETEETPNILFHGPAGTGKTALATAFAKDLYGDDWRRNFLELNASDDRGIDVVRDRIKTYAEQGPAGDYQYKLIFLDEVDSTTNAAQGALRRVMEDYTANTRFILSCNYVGQLIDPIQSRCAPFAVSPLGHMEVKKVLKRVVDGEGLEVKDDALDLIAHHASGDARRAINTLQAATIGDRITADSVDSAVSLVDTELIEEIVTQAFAGNLEDAMETLTVDILKEGVDSQTLAREFMTVLREAEMPEDSRVKCIDRLGETEWRCVQGANPYIQWHSFLAHLTVARHLSLKPYREAMEE